MSSDKIKILDLEGVFAHLGDPRTMYHHKTVRFVTDALGSISTINWWQFREAMRFVVGGYQPVLPFDNDFQTQLICGNGLLNTWPHISLSDPTMVSYTATSDDGRADRQIRSKFGKYLTRYNGAYWNYTEPEIAALANAFNTTQTPPALVITTDPDEIREAYMRGPHSCMSYEFENLPVHPSEVYACKPPLALAYTRNAKNEITARALVRTDTKVYARPYGNEFALTTLLAAEGYTCDKDGLHGLEVRYIPTRGNYIVMPYVDAPTSYALINTELQKVVLSTTEMDSMRNMLQEKYQQGFWHYANVQNTSGIVSTGIYDDYGDNDDTEYISCDCCGDRTLFEDTSETYDGAQVCPDCVDNHYTFAILPSEEEALVHNDYVRYIEAYSSYIHHDIDALVYFDDLAYNNEDDLYISIKTSEFSIHANDWRGTYVSNIRSFMVLKEIEPEDVMCTLAETTSSNLAGNIEELFETKLSFTMSLYSDAYRLRELIKEDRIVLYWPLDAEKPVGLILPEEYSATQFTTDSVQARMERINVKAFEAVYQETLADIICFGTTFATECAAYLVREIRETDGSVVVDAATLSDFAYSCEYTREFLYAIYALLNGSSATNGLFYAALADERGTADRIATLEEATRRAAAA